MGLKAILVNEMLKAARGTSPATLSIRAALHTGEPTSGNEITTANSPGYDGEQTIGSNGWTVETDGSNRIMKNSSEVSWGDPTANWAAVTHIGFWNGAPGGSNLLASQTITPGTITSAASKVYSPAGALKIGVGIDT